MFYSFDKDYLVSLGFSETKAVDLCKKGTHRVVDNFLKNNPNDFYGAILKLLDYINSKNVYSIERYIKKGFSEEEALEKVRILKSKTSGSLENFIKRHGEVNGYEKYKEFCKKSAHTEATFMKKYGDDWEVKWNEYRRSKESRSDLYFKNKYGVDWETKKDEVITSWKNKLSLDGFKKKFGESVGEQKYADVQKRKASTLENMIAKHGEEKGTNLYNRVMQSRYRQNTVERYLEQYGDEEGYLLYIEKCKRCATSLENMINKYGLQLGSEAYESLRKKQKGRFTVDWFIEKYGEEAGRTAYFEKYKKLKGSLNRISKSSIKFFDKLNISIGGKLVYGEVVFEKCLVRDNGRLFFYDAVDEENKIIFEWNGSAFHYHESFDDNWKSAFGKTKDESIAHEKEKKEVAELNGYRYCVIWDFECDSECKTFCKIEEIKKGFYEKS